MQLTQRITELCLSGEPYPYPFAVLVEQGHQCGWAVASGLAQDRRWLGHVLKHKQRREDESWVLDSWASWLSDIAQEPSDRRLAALENLEASTPGLIVRRPRTARTRLPVQSLALQWQRRRLHDSAEAIAANMAARLASPNGTAHWAASIDIDGHEPLCGDWVVEHRPQPGAVAQTTDREQFLSPEFTSRAPMPTSTTSVAAGLALIHVVDAEQVDSLKYKWGLAKQKLATRYPYSIAVVRDSTQVAQLDIGCVIGERFPAAESIAVAAVRAEWSKARSVYEADGR